MAAVPPVAPPVVPPPPAPVAAYVPNGGAPITAVQAAALATQICTPTYVVPVPRALAAGHADATTVAMANVIPQVIKLAATEARQEMLGVTMTDVMAAGYTALVLALHTNSFNSFLQDCVLAVNMGPTVARNRVVQYAALAPASMFRQFEISGRAADLTTPMGIHGQWVQGSPMHAQSVRLWGLALLANAAPGGFLARVRDRMGSILAPPAAPAAGVEESERAKLLRQAAGELTPIERNLVTGLMPRFTKVMALLDQIYGAAGGNLDLAIRAAGLYQGFEL